MHRNDTIGVFMRIGLFVVIALALVIKSHAQEPDETIEHETGFYYTVQKGDTLWDISQHFNDTPWLWPELWKENDQIPNPHWIYPGERIRLYHGMGKYKYQKAKNSQFTEPIPALQPISSTKLQPLAPVVNEKHVYYAGIDQVGFIRKEPVNCLGHIFKVEGNSDKKMISTGDTIYIQPLESSDTNFAPGGRYTVYRSFAPTEGKKSIQRIGTQYYLLGIIEVYKNETGYSIAKVVDIYREMAVGDRLMPYNKRPSKIPVADAPIGLEGKIITAEDHNEIIGENAIAFINKGENDNIQPGQNFDIYYRMEQSRHERKKLDIDLVPIKIGSFVVLHTEKETSTVLIYDSSQSISSGEKFHTATATTIP